MNWKRFFTAVGYTLREYGFDLFSALLVKPVRTQVANSVTSKRSSPWLSQEFWSARTVDGAIVGGSVPPGAWAKFTLPKGLPVKGTRRLAVEGPAHEIDGFSGQIPQGYGKGIKTLLYRDMAVIKIGRRTFPGKVEYHFHEADVAGPHHDLCIEGVPSRTKEFEINIPNGDFRGRYAFRTTAKGVVVVPMVDRGVVLPKPQYNLKPAEFLKNLPPGKWISEVKLDGSMANASIHESRATFRSHRETGETYYDRLPQLEFLSNQSRFLANRFVFPHPDVNGTVFKGELVHPDGAPRMSGILNALPHRARQIQALRGSAKFCAWDIVKYHGRDVSRRPYEERRALTEATIKEIRLFNKHWDIVGKCLEGQDPYDFYQETVKLGLPYGEGIVVKDASQPAGEGTWFKVKARDTLDLKVTGFIQGNGKFQDSVGAIIVEGNNGNFGEVGSFRINDTERKYLWDNRESLVGETAEILAMELTEKGIPRAGVFIRFHGDKSSENALRMYAESLAGSPGELANNTLFALKSSAGWRAKKR